MNLFKHQIDVLKETEEKIRVAYYLDMGLGKTFVGFEKMKILNKNLNLVVCQKSKIQDWKNHMIENSNDEFEIYDLTKNCEMKNFESSMNSGKKMIGVINYDLTFRRPILKKMKDFTLMLDESSLIQNEQAKRSRFILSMNPSCVILLSGTCVGGKYENLWSQCRLLGWNISKSEFWNTFIITRNIDVGGFQIPIVVGYKNILLLKQKLREHGAVFLKTKDVLNLPEQVEIFEKVDQISAYKKFMKDSIVEVQDKTLIGENILTKRLYARQLCGHLNKNKLEKFRELIESTDDRLIVFYNFTEELEAMKKICKDRPISIVNGKTKNLDAYEKEPNSITFIQYQAGAMGLNLQKANKSIFFSLTESSELFEQAKKRTHRIGQENTCFYYFIMTKDSVEEDIWKSLKNKNDYTNELFKGYMERNGRRKKLRKQSEKIS